MNKIRNILKKIGFGLLAIVLLILIAGYMASEKRPTGIEGEAAEKMADNMLQVLHYKQWKEIAIIEWDFPGGHHHLWDKKRDFVEVTWDDNRVIFNTQTKDGMAWKLGKPIIEKDLLEEVIEEAWGLFANDSFWLCAPFKVKDPGTKRSLVEYEGQDGLLVTYTSGGTTPGDAYLWLMDEKGFPTSYKMWVSIIPIGGLEFSWDGWQKHKGAWIAAEHQSNILFGVDLENIETYNSFSERGNGIDPFKKIIL